MPTKLSKIFDPPNQAKITSSWKKTRRTYAFLFFFFIFFLLFNLVWFINDNLPPHWDMTQHLSHAFDYYDLLRQGKIFAFLWKNYSYYPPFVYQITALLYLFLGSSLWINRLLISFCYFLLFFLTFLLGKKIASQTTGIVTAFCAILIPMMYVFSRDFLLDIPLTVFFLLSLYLLFSNPFQNWKKAVLLGITLGLGMLTKWTFAAFIIGPFFFFAVLFIWKQRGQLKTFFLHLFLIIFANLIVAGPWYGFHLFEFLRDLRNNIFIVPMLEKDPLPGTAEYFFYYLSVLLNQYFYLPLFLLLIFGFWKLLQNKKWLLLTFFLSIILPVYGIFTIVLNKDPRYILPLIPILCLVIAYGITNIKKPRLKFYAAFFVFTYLTIQFLGSIFDLNYFSKEIAIPSPNRYIVFYDKYDPPIYYRESSIWNSPVLGEWVIYSPFSYFGRLPRKENWQLEKIVQKIKNNDRVFIDVDNDVYFNRLLLVYYAKKDGKKMKLVPTKEEATFLISREENKGENCEVYQLPNGKKVYVCRLSKA